MKVLKNETYNSILQAARTEFIRKGYKETSMRDIARQAGTGVGNIYNYFENKDDIYLTIMKPAKEELFRYITQRHKEENVDINHMPNFGHFEEDIDQYIDLIHNYKEELHLLLFRSGGSSMQGFRDTFTDHLTHITYDYMELEKKHYPETKEISGFFIRTMSSWMVSIVLWNSCLIITK